MVNDKVACLEYRKRHNRQNGEIMTTGLQINDGG